MIEKKIKNIELVTIALYEIGGANKPRDTEDIAVKADQIDDERFKWKNKKYKKFIDKGLVLESLKAAKNRAIGSFLKGNDEKGWTLSATGLEFCKNSKHKFKGVIVRKKRLTKIEKNYLLREEYRITGTDAFIKYYNEKKDEIVLRDILKLFKVDDYTTKKDVEKRILKLLDNFPDQHPIYQLINNYKKEVMQYVNK
jgi:hypothetical protein